MTEPEVLRLIKQHIRTELCQTLGGSISQTDDQYTCSLTRFLTDSPINGARLIRPYGFTSRPKPTVPTVVHPINGDSTHLISLGDFDIDNRPNINDGEAALYGSSGQAVYTNGTDVAIGDYQSTNGNFLPMPRAAFHEDGSYEIGTLKTVSSNVAGEVFIGSPTASSPLVLGDVLATFLDQIIAVLSTALSAIQAGPIAISTNVGDPAPTAPGVVAALSSAVSSLAALQATYVDSPSTNFNSNSNFTQKEAA